MVLVKQENRGLTRSLNRGLRLAIGEYVARMDADDVSHPRRIEAQVREVERNTALDLVGTFFDIVDEEGRLQETKELILDPIYRLWRLQFHNNYGHGTMLMRKQAVTDAGMYDERLRHAQDFDLWSRLSRKCNTMIVPEVLYSYRMVQRSQQTSVKNYDSQLAAAIGVSDRSLMACNGDLSEADCVEVRALYWKFQRDRVSLDAMRAIPRTLEGFCRRFDIKGSEQSALVQQVIRDAEAEIRAQEKPLSEEWSVVLGHLQHYRDSVSGPCTT
jgi:glycosyltransferase involved in cell wall biosynthesis